MTAREEAALELEKLARSLREGADLPRPDGLAAKAEAMRLEDLASGLLDDPKRRLEDFRTDELMAEVFSRLDM